MVRVRLLLELQRGLGLQSEVASADQIFHSASTFAANG